MAVEIHPQAPEHFQSFITAPGETDYLLVGSIIFLLMIFVLLGALYLKLHSLPERIAHGASQVQFQLVAVLSLIALLTHTPAFWFAALFFAIVPIPDFWTPLSAMSESLAKIANRRSEEAGPSSMLEPGATSTADAGATEASAAASSDSQSRDHSTGEAQS